MPGEVEKELSFTQEEEAVQFDLPGNLVAGVVEII